jgi:proline iminopeptidase
MRLLILLLFFIAISCKQATTDMPASQTNYFVYGDSVESGGVKMIPIHTPVGDFKVWTKRFGSNPKIKVLLLHGGPAMTH